MLLLSNNLRKLVASARPKTIIPVPDGELWLFLSSIENDLLESGYLNIVLRQKSGEFKGISIDCFQASKLAVVGQEGLKKLNASRIMGITASDQIIKAQHWDGYQTQFRRNTLEVVRQIFTK